MSKQNRPEDTDAQVKATSDQDSPALYLANYLPNRERQAFPLSDITTQLGLTGPRIPALQLVDQPFVILAAKPFGSSFAPDRHAYFCVCRMEASAEVFTTVLGGWAVVDILDAIVQSEFREPLLCTLRKVEGGRYGRYYVLE